MATPYLSGTFSPKSFTDSNSYTIWRPEPLARSVSRWKWIIIRAFPTNTGFVCVGDERIAATELSGTSLIAATNPRGVWLFAGERWEDTDVDLSQIFIDVSVANEGVSYTVGNA